MSMPPQNILLNLRRKFCEECGKAADPHNQVRILFRFGNRLSQYGVIRHIELHLLPLPLNEAAQKRILRHPASESNISGRKRILTTVQFWTA